MGGLGQGQECSQPPHGKVPGGFSPEATSQLRMTKHLAAARLNTRALHVAPSSIFQPSAIKLCFLLSGPSQGQIPPTHTPPGRQRAGFGNHMHLNESDSTQPRWAHTDMQLCMHLRHMHHQGPVGPSCKSLMLTKSSILVSSAYQGSVCSNLGLVTATSSPKWGGGGGGVTLLHVCRQNNYSMAIFLFDCSADLHTECLCSCWTQPGH